jgi:leucyl/phenylalanyl-tRNA---protein transferase
VNGAFDTGVRFPSPDSADEHGVVAVGEDFRLGTLLTAYRMGIFPWPHSTDRGDMVLWCSPDPRCIFELGELPHWSRSLRRTLRTGGFRISVDLAFPEVMRDCGATRPDGTWINRPLRAGYTRLFDAGFAHSVEVWRGTYLVGGIYGVAIGGAFAGESMFHRETDASKVAFAALALLLRSAGFALFDVQVRNPHLESLGCVEVPRPQYLQRLERALTRTPRPIARAEWDSFAEFSAEQLK